MNTNQLLELLIANLPIIIACAGAFGLLSFVAGHIRRGVVEARKAAAKSPGKLDDFIVDAVDGPLLEVADLIERGDIEGAKKKVGIARLALTKAKR